MRLISVPSSLISLEVVAVAGEVADVLLFVREVPAPAASPLFPKFSSIAFRSDLLGPTKSRLLIKHLTPHSLTPLIIQLYPHHHQNHSTNQHIQKNQAKAENSHT